MCSIAQVFHGVGTHTLAWPATTCQRVVTSCANAQAIDQTMTPAFGDLLTTNHARAIQAGAEYNFRGPEKRAAHEVQICKLAGLGYRGGMLPRNLHRELRSPWRILLGALCIGLVMFGSILSVAHTHADGEMSHADCGLCVTAHMSVQAAPAPVQIPVVHVFAEIEASIPLSRPQSAPEFALFSRPPPADSDRS